MIRSGSVLITQAVAALLILSSAQAQAGHSWCAQPRVQDPLLLEAQQLGTSEDPVWAGSRAEYNLPRVSPEAITVVRDEATCHRAATAYRDQLRRFVDKAWPDSPVLVVRIGDKYLVDDQRPREGPDEYWEVMVFDKNWGPGISYGGGD